MKKSLLLIVAVAGLLSAAAVEAKGWKHGGHHGGGHHGGWRHHGWGHRRHGWGPGFGFGISVGGPSYYEPEVVYIDNPYDWYWEKYPRASWESYRAWLRSNEYRLRRPWRYYYGPRFHRRWKARPRVGFGIGFGL